MRMITLAYHLGKLKGVKEVDESKTPIVLRQKGGYIIFNRKDFMIETLNKKLEIAQKDAKMIDDQIIWLAKNIEEVDSEKLNMISDRINDLYVFLGQK